MTSRLLANPRETKISKSIPLIEATYLLQQSRGPGPIALPRVGRESELFNNHLYCAKVAYPNLEACEAMMSGVSIIIPARNAAATLNATIKSVIHQSHTDWEAIIIDDGSTDSTKANAQAWCDRDSRIRLVIGRSRGSSAARNDAARYALNDWLLFLDADDLILANHLKKMLAKANDFPSADIIYCGGAKIISDGRIDRAEIPPHQNHFEHLASRNIFNIHACLVRREMFNKLGGFDEGLRSCEEWDLWQRIARAGAVFAGVEEPLTLYRLKPRSLSHDVDLLFRNALQVIERGHGRDPRLANPLPAYANGMPGEEAPLAIIAFAVWCAGILIGSHRDAETFLRQIELPRPIEFKIEPVVSMMLGGVPIGACALYRSWPATLWPQYQGFIQRAFAILQERSAIPDLAARCFSQLEAQVRHLSDTPEETDTPETKVKKRSVLAGRPGEKAPYDPIVLMYHRINRLAYDPWNICVSPENFSEQLIMLKDHRDIVPLSWLAEELKQGRVPKRAAALTFDDGYADVLFNAKPLLQKNTCPATFFLTTGSIADQRGFWWDVLARIILNTETLPSELELDVNGEILSWRLKTRGGSGSRNEPFEVSRSDLCFSLWKLLKSLDSETRYTTISLIANWAGTHADGMECDRILNPAEVRELHEAGFLDVGAHTVTHPSLLNLTTAEQRREIANSRTMCERLVHSSVCGFAYPFGDFDDSLCSEVNAAGFDFACVTEERPIHLPQDLMRLPRLFVGNWNATEFENSILRRQ